MNKAMNKAVAGIDYAPSHITLNRATAMNVSSLLHDADAFVVSVVELGYWMETVAYDENKTDADARNELISLIAPLRTMTSLMHKRILSDNLGAIAWALSQQATEHLPQPTSSLNTPANPIDDDPKGA